MTKGNELPSTTPQYTPDLRRHYTRVVVFSMLLAWLVLVVIVVAVIS